MVITYKEDQEIYEKCGHNYKIITGSLAFDSSYPTNGEPMDLSKQIPTDIHMVIIEPSAGYILQYDYTNKKVKAYWNDYNAGADAALIEVTNTTDLSGLTDVRFMAVGK